MLLVDGTKNIVVRIFIIQASITRLSIAAKATHQSKISHSTFSWDSRPAKNAIWKAMVSPIHTMLRMATSLNGINSALLATCVGNSPATGEYPAQRPVTRSFDVFFHLRLNKRLSKQSWGWWFEKPSRLLWRQCDVGNIRNGKYRLLAPVVSDRRRNPINKKV